MIFRKHRPQSEQGSSGGCILVFMGLIFTGVGGTLFFGILGQPFLQLVDSWSWNETPAWIEPHESSSELEFAYTIDGIQYTNTRIRFGDSAHDATGLTAIYPAGSETTCYVSPDDMSQAVLLREIDVDNLVGGAFSSIFLFVGLALLAGGVLTSGKRGALRESSWKPSSVSSAETSASANAFAPALSGDGPVELEEQAPPGVKLGCFSIIALIWNGITFTALYGTISEGEWGAVLFLMLFLAVGIALIVGVIYLALAMFNARPTLLLPRREVVSGETLTLGWRLKGNVSVVEDLTISMIGKESATYRRGTRTVTDRHEFLNHRLVKITEKGAFREGELVIDIPSGLMHSFEASNNKIQYVLSVHGTIRRWPDISSEFEIVVAPRR